MKSGKQSGFTMVELMVVAAVIAILSAIALPSYNQHVLKTNRSAAQSVMLNAAAKQVQFFLDTRTYSTSITQLVGTLPAEVSARYSIVPTVSAGPPPGFTLTATPIGAQLADTKCNVLTLTDTGAKSASGTAPSTCW